MLKFKKWLAQYEYIITTRAPVGGNNDNLIIYVYVSSRAGHH